MKQPSLWKVTVLGEDQYPSEWFSLGKGINEAISKVRKLMTEREIRGEIIETERLGVLDCP
jgi:hypothetical protein